MSIQTMQASGQIAVTAATAIRSRNCEFWGVQLIPGSATSTVTVYDNASAASGTVIAVLSGAASAAPSSLILNIPVECANGITIAVAGTGATAIIYSALM